MEAAENILATEPMVERVEAPRHPHQPAFPKPGIYFGMPMEEYHSIHACSSSGLKKMAVSSMDYWAMSVLNEEREEEAEKDTGKLTPKQLGQAYHTYICEGQAEFDKRYAIALDKDEIEAKLKDTGKKLCVTIADIREAIDDAGIKPKGTAKGPLIEQLLEADPHAWVWDRMVEAYNDEHKGKLFISPKLYRRIVIANRMITSDPQLKGAFTGGHSEVSVFWYDEETGIPCKARFDYLKMNHLIDLKSFSNMGGMPVQQAINRAISNQRYYLSVAFYLRAIEAAKKLVRETGGKRGQGPTRGINDIVQKWNEIESDEVDALHKWAWQWAHQPEPEVLFVFQQTGIAPVTRGRIMTQGTQLELSRQAMLMLMRKWRKCAVAYGTDPWVDFEPVKLTVDDELPPWGSDFGDIEFDGGEV